jgi:UDP-2-acetamido-2,6-beta-L-arabino-hexul-4-ose reductase
MNVCVIGSNGFIARNLIFKLKYQLNGKIFKITRDTKDSEILRYFKNSSYIFHFAGTNRIKRKNDYYENNFLFTKKICDLLKSIKNKPQIVFSSSTQILKKNEYGKTKKKAEDQLLKLHKINKNKIHILRLPNVFGKWSKPNYNSFISTLCYNYGRKKKSKLVNKNQKLQLLYIDDLVNFLIKYIKSEVKLKKLQEKFDFTYVTTINEVNSYLKQFSKTRDKFITDFSNSFKKKLYSTYLSYLPKKDYHYRLKKFNDRRGDFVEFLKSNYFGQISYFTINKKQSRGGHFHNTKVEKFFVVSGKAKFEMLNFFNNKKYEFFLDEKNPRVVESIPGMPHTITNIGSEVVKVILWTNEIYDKKIPDTFKV